MEKQTSVKAGMPLQKRPLLLAIAGGLIVFIIGIVVVFTWVAPRLNSGGNSGQNSQSQNSVNQVSAAQQQDFAAQFFFNGTATTTVHSDAKWGHNDMVFYDINPILNMNEKFQNSDDIAEVSVSGFNLSSHPSGATVKVTSGRFYHDLGYDYTKVNFDTMQNQNELVFPAAVFDPNDGQYHNDQAGPVTAINEFHVWVYNAAHYDYLTNGKAMPNFNADLMLKYAGVTPASVTATLSFVYKVTLKSGKEYQHSVSYNIDGDKIVNNGEDTIDAVN